MSFSPKHIADLFHSCKIDLQRTESLLGGADRSRRPPPAAPSTPGGAEDMISALSTVGQGTTKAKSVITPQQASLHYQREVASLLSTVAGRMVSSAPLDDFVSENLPKKFVPPSSNEDSDNAADSATTAPISSDATEKIKFKLTRGFLKAFDMAIEAPDAVILGGGGAAAGPSSSPAEAHQQQEDTASYHTDTSSSSSILLEQRGVPLELREVLLKRVSESSSSSSTAFDASSAAATQSSSASSPLVSSSLHESLRFLPEAELTGIVSRLWLKVFAAMARGLFYTDLYSNLVGVAASSGKILPPAAPQSDASASVASAVAANQKLALSEALHAILTSDACAQQLRGVAEALYFTGRPSGGASKMAKANKTFLPLVFHKVFDVPFWQQLNETVQGLFEKGRLPLQNNAKFTAKIAPNSLMPFHPSFAPPLAWSQWFQPLLTASQLHPSIIALFLTGLNNAATTAGIGKSAVDATDGANLDRFRKIVIAPLINAAKDVFSAILSNELPSDDYILGYKSRQKRRMGDDDEAEEARHKQAVLVALKSVSDLFVDALTNAMTAHYTAAAASDSSPAASSSFTYADALLRTEVAAPIISHLKAAVDEHCTRTKTFGLPTGVLETILGTHATDKNSHNDNHHVDGKEDAAQMKTAASLLPSRLLMNHLYFPLRRNLASFVREDDDRTPNSKEAPLFRQPQKETALTMLYHILACVSQIADGEEEVIVSARQATIHAASAGATAAAEGAAAAAASGIKAAAVAIGPPAVDAIRVAIKRAFERRGHLIDRSEYDGVGGGGAGGGDNNATNTTSSSFGIVYKWNKDVFTSIVGELGLPLTSLGARPIEEGGHEVFKLTIPSSNTTLPPTATPAAAAAAAASSTPPPPRQLLTYHVFVEKGLLKAKAVSNAAGASSAVQPSTAPQPQRGQQLLGRGVGGLIMGGQQKRPAMLMGGGAAAAAVSKSVGNASEAPSSFTVVEAFERFFGGEGL